MASHPDYPRTRLFVEHSLAANEFITLDERQSHYLHRVLRLQLRDRIALFNGKDGEWLGVIVEAGKKVIEVQIISLLRAQYNAPDIWLLAAPLKNSKTEWVVEKATELGVSCIVPVSTHYTVIDRVNAERLKIIATEAAEQSERMDVPLIAPLIPLAKLLGDWKTSRHILFGDESGGSEQALASLKALHGQPIAVLIGPEGGFSPAELEILRVLPYVTGMCMGPRILRADTAALAALTLVQAAHGDWSNKPAFRSGNN